MPVFNAGGDFDDCAWSHFNRLFSPFLIPAAAANADQSLSTAAFCVMDMPVVAAAWFEGHVEDGQIALTNRSNPALLAEILGKAIVWHTNWVIDGFRVFFKSLRFVEDSFTPVE